MAIFHSYPVIESLSDLHSSFFSFYPPLNPLPEGDFWFADLLTLARACLWQTGLQRVRIFVETTIAGNSQLFPQIISIT
jgi:hypothetical protein